MRLKLFFALGICAATQFAAPAHAMVLPAFIFGDNICMRNVNRWLEANGFGSRATHSASSLSIRGNGHHRTRARYGAVRFNFRGPGHGHAVIILDQVWCLNPGKHGWQKKRCNSIWAGRPFEIWW